MLSLQILLCAGAGYFNYRIAKKDLFNPGVLFCLVFLICSMIALIGMPYYQYVWHWQTTLIIFLGLAAFSAVNWACETWYLKNDRVPVHPVIRQIRLNRIWPILLVILQILCIFFFIRYLSSLAQAAGEGGSLKANIDLYDTLTKFRVEEFEKLNVPVPIFYRLFNPVCEAGAYIMIYISVNNYVAIRKVSVARLLSILLLAVLIVLNGSRTPLFRVATMILFLFYYLKVRRSTDQEARRRFLKAAAVVLAACMILFVGVLLLMGRDNGGQGIIHYLFVYTGAPLANLNSFVSGGSFPVWDGRIGPHVFRNLYIYLEKLTGSAFFGVPEILYFQHAPNGMEIGNVYTMFYQTIYDFGYWGIVPLTALMAAFYCLLNRHLMYRPAFGNGRFSLQLFFYCYLINDLLMSAFSNRFYETILEAPFLKIALITLILCVFIIDWKDYRQYSIVRAVHLPIAWFERQSSKGLQWIHRQFVRRVHF